MYLFWRRAVWAFVTIVGEGDRICEAVVPFFARASEETNFLLHLLGLTLPSNSHYHTSENSLHLRSPVLNSGDVIKWGLEQKML